ncbi:MAG TPA: amidohydrolase [Candidatus Dormibacteraeota bacterium]
MAALLITNGKVWSQPAASTVLVEADRIMAVGADLEIPRGARVIDADGASILPAFNDAHVHFLMASRALGQLDLFGVKTQAEIETRISEYTRSQDSDWVLGRGWFYSAFPGGMPTVALLDQLVPDRPAYLESFDAHTGWANSRALAMAGAPDAGVLKEEAMLVVTTRIPGRTQAQDLAALRAGMRVAASRGVGSVQEAGDGMGQLPLWLSLRDAGELTVRVRLAFDMTPGVPMEDWKRRLNEYAEARRDRDPWISTGILKAFADGVVESKTAALFEPYAGTDERGSPLWGREELRQAVAIADGRGWQVQVHAIGDAAIRQALDAFEGTAPGRRHRVEHIEAPRPSDLPRFAALGVIASMQPQHADPNLTEVWRRNLGPERAARGWPWREILRSGGRLAFGTDWPVVPLEPFASLELATQALTAEQAISAWTSGSAYAEHADGEKGEIREGMLADIAVVDLDGARVRATVVGGAVVYEE